MISEQHIKHLKGKREYFARIKDKERLRQLDKEERHAWRDDLTQPSDSRFRMLYPKSYREMEKTTQKVEQDKVKDKKQKDALLHQFRHNSSEKKALMNLFNHGG